MDIYRHLGIEGKKAIILHHDDLGMLHAHELAYRRLGYPSGAVVVNGVWTTSYVDIPGADLGVHLTLANDWKTPRYRPLSTGSSLRNESGFFYETLEDAWQNINLEDAVTEMRAQLEAAYAAGLDVTHIDTHMGAVLRPDIAEEYINLAMQNKLPPFLADRFIETNLPEPLQDMIIGMLEKSQLPKYCMVSTYDFPVEKREEKYLEVLSVLKPGVYHFIHHAACGTTEARVVPDWQVRRADYRALMDKRVRELIDKEFILLTYRDIRDALRKYSS